MWSSLTTGEKTISLISRSLTLRKNEFSNYFNFNSKRCCGISWSKRAWRNQEQARRLVFKKHFWVKSLFIETWFQYFSVLCFRKKRYHLLLLLSPVLFRKPFPICCFIVLSFCCSPSQECEVDGETFIGMDLLDIHGLTPKLKLRKLLRLAWTEVTGMVTNTDDSSRY